MSQPKKKLIFVVFVLAALVMGTGIFMLSESTSSNAEPVTTAEAPKPAAAAAPATPEAPAAAASSTMTKDDIAALAKPRILGNPKAPVMITEHSSFTCSHCADFHRTNLKQIKADYVDTGKAYIVFDDFPRNEIDIMIGSLARCVEGDAYFNFVQLLFETQAEWAQGDFKAHVKQNAMIAGLSDERAEACMNNTALQEALAANRKIAMDKFNVNSTPTLVLNDRKVISGMSPYEDLKKAIDEELAASTSKEAIKPPPQ